MMFAQPAAQRAVTHLQYPETTGHACRGCVAGAINSPPLVGAEGYRRGFGAAALYQLLQVQWRRPVGAWLSVITAPWAFNQTRLCRVEEYTSQGVQQRFKLIRRGRWLLVALQQRQPMT